MKRNRDRGLGRALVDVPFYWALCLSQETFFAELRMLKVTGEWPLFVPDDKDACVHWFTKIGAGGKDCVFICMRDMDKRTPIEVAGLLVHEAVHVWQEVCLNMGEKKPSREFEAYSIQRLSLNLMEAYAKTLT